MSGLEDGHAEEEDGVDAGKLLPEHQQQTEQKQQRKTLNISVKIQGGFCAKCSKRLNLDFFKNDPKASQTK